MCKQPLKDVDHSDEIKVNKLTLEGLIKGLKELEVEVEEAKMKLKSLIKSKKELMSTIENQLWLIR